MDTGALDESETLEDRVVKEIAKRKERSEARKRQRATKKLKEAQGLAIEAGDDVSGFISSFLAALNFLVLL
jgi:hypothetical protein